MAEEPAPPSDEMLLALLGAPDRRRWIRCTLLDIPECERTRLGDETFMPDAVSAGVTLHRAPLQAREKKLVLVQASSNASASSAKTTCTETAVLEPAPSGYRVLARHPSCSGGRTGRSMSHEPIPLSDHVLLLREDGSSGGHDGEDRFAVLYRFDRGRFEPVLLLKDRQSYGRSKERPCGDWTFVALERGPSGTGSGGVDSELPPIVDAAPGYANSGLRDVVSLRLCHDAEDPSVASVDMHVWRWTGERFVEQPWAPLGVGGAR